MYRSKGFTPLNSRVHVDTQRLFASILEDTNSPMSRKIISQITAGDHASVISNVVDPSTYTDADTFRDDYFAAQLVSKFPNWDTGVDRAAVALANFLQAEERCRVTNEFLRHAFAGGAYHSKTLSAILYGAQRLIGNLLSEFSWEEASRHFGFGPGSSISLPRSKGDAYYKFGNTKPTTTEDNFDAAASAICSCPSWLLHVLFADSVPGDLVIVPGNKVSTVPKNAKTDRVIATEPDMNMYIQKGIGAMIRKRLKRVGVNLDSQELNQHLASIGAETGLATIDLRSASDTVSLELVKQLLPPDWVDAIMMCRSPVGVLPDGTVLTYQKVSSMGNGFTFELESLIFWAITRSVTDFRNEKDRRLAVYGDDIIVPAESAPLLVSILGLVGFETNTSKSYLSGRFRESCGKHYFDGVDVTPFYIRDDIDTPERLLWLANSIRRYACLWGSRSYCDSRYVPSYVLVKSFLPKSLRTSSVPLFSEGKAFSDTALGGDFDEVRPRFNRRLFVYEAVHYVRVYKMTPVDGIPYLLRCLYFLEQRDSDGGGGVKPGISTQAFAYRKIKTCITQWDQVGPWL